MSRTDATAAPGADVRRVCIHGHFYQPPRENAWTGLVDEEPGAAPFHDWNQRIDAECYAPNARARILDPLGEIKERLSNYAWMSFDFGPTLLAWLERHAADTYAAVLAADRDGARHFGGHGTAMAQAYNHSILPLLTPRDRRTQVAWGVADFVHRFGRRPSGMWLPECAVSTDSLEALGEAGIGFTVLASRQLRPPDAAPDDPREVVTSVPHRVTLPSGRSIVVFAYHGALAQAIAFDGLLRSGEDLAQRLMAATSVTLPGTPRESAHGGAPPPAGPGAPRAAPGARLASVATDGETYGHHHRFGEMALAYAIRRIQASPDVRLTTFAQFLAEHPETAEAVVVEDTSWSCAHGVERWRSDCGCSTGQNPGFDQAWRAPLRRALDGLREALDAIFERQGAPLFHDPWAARDGSIALWLDGSAGAEEAFFAAHARGGLDAKHRSTARMLLEMARQGQLMFTSCGWFFDDVGGLETRQVLGHAARALELAEGLSGEPLQAGFVAALALARSNRPEVGDGRAVFLAAQAAGRRGAATCRPATGSAAPE